MELFKRIFIPHGGYKRVFSIIRLIALIIGACIASVYFITGNILASFMFAAIAYILFRYGQIKGYLK